LDITFRTAAATRSLAAVAALLVIVNLALQVVRWSGDHQNILGLLDLFDLNREKNVPTLFATVLLSISAVLLVANGGFARAAALPAAGWFGLAALFAYFAVDEAWQLHERLVRPLRTMLPTEAPAWTHFAWVIPGGMLVAIVGVLYLQFLRRLHPVTRRRIIVAGCVYVAGALGMEMVDGAWAATHGQDNLVYSLLTTIEEGLELTGLVLFTRALLDNLAVSGRSLALRLDAEGHLRLTIGPRYFVPVEAAAQWQVGDEAVYDRRRVNNLTTFNVQSDRRRASASVS